MKPEEPRRIGLVAGAGDIPPYFAHQASKKGMRIVSVGFSDEIASRLSPFSEKTYSIGLGRVGKIFRTLKDENICDLIILGKVDKKVIFQPQIFDLRSLKILKDLRNKEDKTLLLAMIGEVEKEGFHVLDQREFLGEIFPPAGLLTKRSPSKEEQENIDFGFSIAKRLADMEIGQTLVVKDKTVVSVEALEGTDRAIERGCHLARGNCIVIKVSRTGQDYRYDSPGVGPETIERMMKGGAAGLALEGGGIMVANQPEVVEMADRAGIFISCI